MPCVVFLAAVCDDVIRRAGYRERTRTVTGHAADDQCPHLSEYQSCEYSLCYRWQTTPSGPCRLKYPDMQCGEDHALRPLQTQVPGHAVRRRPRLPVLADSSTRTCSAEKTTPSGPCSLKYPDMQCGEDHALRSLQTQVPGHAVWRRPRPPVLADSSTRTCSAEKTTPSGPCRLKYPCLLYTSPSPRD